MSRTPTLARATILLLALGVSGAAGAEPHGPPPSNKFGLSQPRPRAPGAIRLMTYNVQNLCDRVDDPKLSGEFDDMKLALTDARGRALADAILAADADVVALQEVESLESLRWFRDTFLPKARYEHLASIDVGYYRGMECSVMSRFKIAEARVWPDASLDDVRREGPGWATVAPERRRGLKFQRSPLMVRVQVNERYGLTLFVVHHKSGGEFDDHREAEGLKAVELVGGVLQSDPACNLVVLGDFNAAPWDKSLRVYLERGLIDTLGHRVIPPRNQPQDEARLYKTHESDRVLDYVLMNSAAHRELVIGSAHVFGTMFPPSSYDWRTDPHPAGYASDHYPVILDLVPRDAM
jgi:endonuclease/exonuclease/phosphatase family metal-dependent hydrolase